MRQRPGRTIGPALAIGCSFPTSFQHGLQAGTVPVGARNVFVALNISCLSSGGQYDNGYADNLSLVLPPLFLPLLGK